MNIMDVIYLLMNCVVTASITVTIASALWSILVLLTDSSDRQRTKKINRLLCS